MECDVEEGAYTGGDGSTDVEERVASTGGLIVVWLSQRILIELWGMSV